MMQNSENAMKNRSMFAGLVLAGLLAGAGAARATSLQPLVAGVYTNGDGVNSQWVQVADDWRGVIYGTTAAYDAWNTGIWGLADANLVLGLSGSDPKVVTTHSAVLDRINWADKRYIDTWSATWGLASLVPFFSNDANQYQENYAARFTGYIAVTDPGAYNFGVLFDDGFRFTLQGQGSTLSLAKDGLNPRERMGFDQDLQLSSGLYGFELVAYERLEAGVVDLSWIQPGVFDWTTVPQAHLYTTPVPEPSQALLMLSALGLLAWAYRRRAARG
jgi:hypothetical protein